MPYSRLNPRPTMRERLAVLLCREGFAVTEYDLIPVTGYWKRADVYRWESVGAKRNADPMNGLGVTIVSWDTMTECVRNGITVAQDPQSPWWFDVHAKEPKPSIM